MTTELTVLQYDAQNTRTSSYLSKTNSCHDDTTDFLCSFPAFLSHEKLDITFSKKETNSKHGFCIKLAILNKFSAFKLYVTLALESCLYEPQSSLALSQFLLQIWSLQLGLTLQTFPGWHFNAFQFEY